MQSGLGNPFYSYYIKEDISYPLFLLFCKSLDEDAVPNDWKESNVSPVYKKGDRSHSENYRPVSLTSVICKLFESIMRDAIVHHLETKLIIGNLQQRFRKGTSCLTNLLSFLDSHKSHRFRKQHWRSFLQFCHSFWQGPTPSWSWKSMVSVVKYYSGQKSGFREECNGSVLVVSCHRG